MKKETLFRGSLLAIQIQLDKELRRLVKARTRVSRCF